MAKKGGEPTLRDKSWALGWPDAPRQGKIFYYGMGIDLDALEVLKQKGWTPVDFRALDGAEKIGAMFEAVTNGVYDPTPPELKALDLHMKHLKEKPQEEKVEKRGQVLDCLEHLQSLSSTAPPMWANVGATASSTPPPPEEKQNIVADLLKGLFKS